MSNGNTVNLVGTVGGDPELRFTPSGVATATFSIAVNKNWQNKQTQEWEQSTSWFDVVCWRELAEHVSESLTRGTRVMISGTLSQRNWETQDGDKRFKIEVVADEVGPSLRWANAEVKKAERQTFNDPTNNSHANDNEGPY